MVVADNNTISFIVKVYIFGIHISNMLKFINFRKNRRMNSFPCKIQYLFTINFGAVNFGEKKFGDINFGEISTIHRISTEIRPLKIFGVKNFIHLFYDIEKLCFYDGKETSDIYNAYYYTVQLQNQTKKQLRLKKTLKQTKNDKT